jgi:hypothetical protein
MPTGRSARQPTPTPQIIRLADRLPGRARNVQDPGHRLAFAIVDPAPEGQQGKFVGIFRELADQWAARRRATAEEIAIATLSASASATIVASPALSVPFSISPRCERAAENLPKVSGLAEALGHPGLVGKPCPNSDKVEGLSFRLAPLRRDQNAAGAPGRGRNATRT